MAQAGGHIGWGFCAAACVVPGLLRPLHGYGLLPRLGKRHGGRGAGRLLYERVLCGLPAGVYVCAVAHRRHRKAVGPKLWRQRPRAANQDACDFMRPGSRICGISHGGQTPAQADGFAVVRPGGLEPGHGLPVRGLGADRPGAYPGAAIGGMAANGKPFGMGGAGLWDRHPHQTPGPDGRASVCRRIFRQDPRSGRQDGFAHPGGGSPSGGDHPAAVRAL